MLNTEHKVGTHMKRFSKKFYKQIMLPLQLKQELDQLKEIVRIDMNVNHPISYADVIKFLIKHYKNSLRVVYPISQRLLVGNEIQKENLNVSIPINPKPFSASSKLDEKIRVSFPVES